MIRPLRRSRRVKESEKGVAFILLDGGREVCTQSTAGRKEYKRRTLQMAERQNNLCAICRLPFTRWHPPTFEHSDGRTAGHRDERTEKDGKPYNAATHGICNRAKGSRRYAWFGSKYREVVRER